MPDYRLTTFTIKVLSSGPYIPRSLTQVAYDIIDGSNVGCWNKTRVKGLTRGQAIKALLDMGSDESFLEYLGNTGE